MNLINKWFDVFNSKKGLIDSRPRMAAYGLKLEVQDRILNRMSDLMANLSVGYKVSRYLYPFQVGIIRNNTALKMLYRHLNKTFGFSFIITNRINQDPVEHFFSTIRGKGRSDHPTGLEFMYRTKQYVLGRGGYLPITGNVSGPSEDVLNMELFLCLYSAISL